MKSLGSNRSEGRERTVTRELQITTLSIVWLFLAARRMLCVISQVGRIVDSSKERLRFWGLEERDGRGVATWIM